MLADQRAPTQEKGVTMLGLEINGSWIKELEGAINKVLDDYENIQQEHTDLQGFNQDECSKCLMADSTYSFSGNIFLQDLRWRPHPSTPVNVSCQQLRHVFGTKGFNLSPSGCWYQDLDRAGLPFSTPELGLHGGLGS